MARLSIVHYSALGNYPPTYNFINVAKHHFDVQAITHHTTIGKDFIFKDVSLKYCGKQPSGKSRIKNLLKQCKFLIFSLLNLMRFRPDVIMYYESVSAPAVGIYKLIYPKCKILAHFHELSRSEDYSRMIFSAKIGNWIERNFLFKRIKFTSQTNKNRKELFLKEFPQIKASQCLVLPNYPPITWGKENGKKSSGHPKKCVLIGSLSLETTYISEFCQWIAQQKGNVTLDLYSYNFKGNLIKHINSLNTPYITFHDKGVDYNSLPQILKLYDVGLILYKPTTLNYIFNETNKLYEYLACGLEVWYPSDMKLIHDMDKTPFDSKFVEMDFTTMRFKEYRSDTPRSYSLFAENIYRDYINLIKE